jgi:hypothetical protein
VRVADRKTTVGRGDDVAAPVIEAKVWDLLLAAWREDPGNLSKAARAAGVSRPTARKALLEGYPGADPPRRAIKDIVDEEKAAARAALQGTIEDSARRHALEDAARKRAEAEKARADAVEARRQEASMVRSQRGNILALIGIGGTILRGALKLGDSIRKDLEDAASGAKEMSLEQKMVVLTRTGLLTQRIASAAGDVVKMERLLLGEPTEILGHKDLGSVGFDEAIRELENAAGVAERIKARRARREDFKLKLIQGGKLKEGAA